MAGKQMKDLLAPLKNCTFIEPQISLKSALKNEQITEIETLAAAIKADL